MASAVESYIKEIRDSLKYWATWAPGTRIELGAWGRLEDGLVFRREANVTDFGISFDTQPNPATGSWNHTSEGQVEINLQATGEAQKIPQVPQGKAGLQIKFKKQHAVVFIAPSGVETAVANVHRLKQELIAKAQEQGPDIFPSELTVVTNVVTADSASALISEERDAEFVLTADADFKAGLQSIADASLNFSIAHSRNVRTELLAKNQATPLFRGFRLKRDWWNGRIEAADVESFSEGDLPFEELIPEETD